MENARRGLVKYMEDCPKASGVTCEQFGLRFAGQGYSESKQELRRWDMEECRRKAAAMMQSLSEKLRQVYDAIMAAIRGKSSGVQMVESRRAGREEAHVTHTIICCGAI